VKGLQTKTIVEVPDDQYISMPRGAGNRPPPYSVAPEACSNLRRKLHHRKLSISRTELLDRTTKIESGCRADLRGLPHLRRHDPLPTRKIRALLGPAMASGPRVGFPAASFVVDHTLEFFKPSPAMDPVLRVLTFSPPTPTVLFPWRLSVDVPPGARQAELSQPGGRQLPGSAALLSPVLIEKSCLGPGCRLAWRSKEPSCAGFGKRFVAESGRASLPVPTPVELLQLAPNRHAR